MTVFLQHNGRRSAPDVAAQPLVYAREASGSGWPVASTLAASAGEKPHRIGRSALYHGWVWTGVDIEIILDDDLTDDPVVAAHILTPIGELLVMAEVEEHERELVLRGLHMHGVTLGPNELGWARLKQLAHAVMERIDVDAIAIEGAVRTSGAHRGRVPRPLRFTRRVPPSGGTELC